ncbi:pilus assembly protein PilY [Verminephrobacter eiseniae]|nr:pilus assembly protein PilY [Verminephrobacter eiseniae]
MIPMSAFAFRKNTPGVSRPRMPWWRRRLLAAGLLLLLAIAASWMTVGGETAPAIPAIDLASTPLYAAVAVEKPALALALATNYAVTGAQYNFQEGASGTDASYTTAKEYLGYYDENSCYRYNDAPTETPVAAQTLADYKRFDRIGPASGRQCSDAFSGNFLNWASGAAIDMFRLMLTGGDRYIDTPALTILQRAMLPDVKGQVYADRCQWNTRDFPAKRLPRNGGGTGNYWGAVPAAMITAANGNDIFVANTLARIYFGTSRTGNCGYTFAHTLGAMPRAIGPIRDARLPPAGAMHCAKDQEACDFSGIKEVWYGAGKRWKVAAVSVGIVCSAKAFGDPGVAQPRNCLVADYSGAWTPPAPSIGPISDTTQRLLPPGTRYCAGEDELCSFSGIQEIWYGKGNQWKVAAASDGVLCSGAVFGASALLRPQGPGQQCHLRDYTGAWAPPGPATPTKYLNSDGFFYARVQVCAAIAGRLQDRRSYDFCQPYPAGNYKPVGVIQKYSNQMRLAVFGYLLDQYVNRGHERYGGVLRVPMKYVGAKTYDIHGRDDTAAGGNPKAEWDPRTGVLHPNPDANAVSVHRGIGGSGEVSGVINYLNQLGRAGPEPGVYKWLNPLGELYYETLRYLQGLRPSPHVIKGTITNAMAGGFPYYMRWPDPYGAGRTNAMDYSCVKSNILVIGDSNAHDRYPLPTPDAGNNIPDIAGWRDIVQKFERNSGGTYVDGQGKTRDIANPNTSNRSLPAWPEQSQIMGTAYGARTHDIRGAGWTARPGKQRPGLRVNTFVFDTNFRGYQNDAAERRSKNHLFMAAKYGGFATAPDLSGRQPHNTWGNPFKDQNGNDDNDVWQKADEPGEASSYHFVDSAKAAPARGLFSALDGIFSQAPSRMRHVAGGSLNTGHRLTRDSVSYSASFDTSTWSGDVLAEPIRRNARHALVVGAPLWSAAQRLDARPAPATGRRIFVGKTDAASGPAATEFIWDQIEPALQAHLNRASASAAPDNRGAERLAYLRGDRSQEGAARFRVRGSLLGDIVNSNISYSGAPAKAFSGAGYAAFRRAHAARRPAVFAGANDGMLHAFDAGTGDELFAYIPSWLGRNLSALTDPGFASQHQNYVDAPSVVAPAQVAHTGGASDWKTVLVSGTGGGGSGLFALDVSDPARFDAAHVLWEFTRADDPDIGQVVGAPKIMKFKTGGQHAGDTYRWFAVVGSGVNNYRPDSDNRFNRDGQPALFLLALDKPVGQAWVRGRNYFKLSVPTDSRLAATHAPGLANFSALHGAQGEVTDIYFGDLHGALWRLHFAGKTTADWSMDQLSFFYRGTAENRRAHPLYLARTGKSEVQAIFAAPALFAGPTVQGVESFHVLIGTGKYLEPADNFSNTTQSVYLLHDDNDSAGAASGLPAGSGSSVIGGRARLRRGRVDQASRTVTVSAAERGPPASGAAAGRSGWYFDLPQAGERIDRAALDVGALSAVMHSKVPAVTAAGTRVCSGMGGGNQYHLNIADGAGNYLPSGSGLPGPPVLLSSDAETRESSSAGRRIRTRTWYRLTQTQSGIDTSAAPIRHGEPLGRPGRGPISGGKGQKNARSGP